MGGITHIVLIDVSVFVIHYYYIWQFYVGFLYFVCYWDAGLGSSGSMDFHFLILDAVVLSYKGLFDIISPFLSFLVEYQSVNRVVKTLTFLSPSLPFNAMFESEIQTLVLMMHAVSSYSQILRTKRKKISAREC